MAGRIPEDIVEQILNETDIVGVVSRYVRLDKKGGRLFGLCPFHSEKTPSFSVLPAKRIFYCFGCHKGGNAIKFISEIEKIPYFEAIRTLADEAGITLQLGDDQAYREKKEAEERVREVLLESARFYFHALSAQAGQEARKYLLKRGVEKSTQRQFGLGFAPDDWNRLAVHLRQKGISEQDAIEAGMCRRSSTGGLIDVFRNRLMIPIFDFFGQIVAFGGRTLGDDKAKYINSQETLLYTKGRHLFGLNLAKRQKGEAFIVTEGYFDTISLHAAGFTTAVALLGTAMSSRQAQLLAQLERPVKLCLDSDEAGVNATLRALLLLREKKADVSVVTMPEFKDPDLYIQHNGRERFEALLNKRVDELDFKLQLIEKRAKSADGALDLYQYQREATDLLAGVEDGVVRELKSKQVAEVLNASPAVVQDEVSRKRHHGTATPVVTEQPIRQAESEPLEGELFVLIALTSSPALIGMKEFELEEEDFLESGFRPFVDRIKSAIAEKRFNYPYLLSLVEEDAPDLARILNEAAVKSDAVNAGADSGEMYKHAVIRLKVSRFEREKRTLPEAIDQEPDEQERKRLEKLLKHASDQYNVWRQMRV